MRICAFVAFLLQIAEPSIAECLTGLWEQPYYDTSLSTSSYACDDLTMYADIGTSKAACCDCNGCRGVVSRIIAGGQTVFEIRYGNPRHSDNNETTWVQVRCPDVSGYKTLEYQGVIGGDCSDGTYTLDYAWEQCYYDSDCVAFDHLDTMGYCIFDVMPLCSEIDYASSNCFYVPIDACPTAAPSATPTAAPPALPQTDVASAYGVIASCSLEDRTFTLEIAESEQDMPSQNDINCDELWGYLENEEYILGENSNVGVCDIEGSSGVPLTVSRYELEEISQCIDPPGKRFKVVSDLIDIDMADHEELADIFIFSIKYSLSPDSPCQNNIDESSSIACEWFDVEKEEFSSAGCELLEIKKKKLDVIATCKCQHLTAFAILQDTVKHKDDCFTSNVFGNHIWIVYVVLYTFVMAIALFQMRYIYGVKKSFKDLLSTKFIIHFHIVFICILNISVAATFLQVNPAKPGNSSIGALMVAWSSLFVLSFWLYSIVVYNWASIYHMDIGKSLHKSVKYIFIVMCFIIAVLIFIVFIMAASSDKDALKTNVRIGSTAVGVSCLLFAFAYLCYGILIVQKLREVNNSVNKSKDPVTGVIVRITKVTFVCFVMFLGQTIIVLISLAAEEVFFSNFTGFQTVYLVFDVSLLFAVMGIFYDVIRKQYYKKELQSYTTSNKSSDVRTV